MLAGQIAEALENQANRAFRDAAPAWLAEAMDKGRNSFRKKLGHALSRRVDRLWPGGLRITCHRDGHANSCRWSVAREDPPDG